MRTRHVAVVVELAGIARSTVVERAACRVLAALSVAVVVVGSGCLADRTLPKSVGARTPCTKTTDCPPENVCPASSDGRAVCLPRNEPACGNGVLDKGEVCDDGNLIAGDGCRADCTREVCGDGIVDPGEACDGSADCNDACALITCGDGRVDSGEDCDNGAANSDSAAEGGCRANCTVVRCGDLVVDAAAGEVCDDGNSVSGDGCSGDCTKVERCGDLFVDAAAGEVCDDGNTASGDGCRGDCGKVEVCGDHVVDANEVCDDGNTTSGDGCRGDCQKAEVCGDGVVDVNEACDDGDLLPNHAQNPNDGCDRCALTAWNVEVITGLGLAAGDALAINLPDPLVAVDRLNRIYFADGNAQLFRMDAIGSKAVVVAGTGSVGFSGDGGPATGARLSAPRGFSIDAAGRLFIADAGNARVRRVDVDGTIHTIAGTGNAAFSGDGGLAIAAELNSPFDAVVDSRGQVFIADLGNCRLRRINAAGIIDSPHGADCGSAGALNQLLDLDVDDQDRVLLAEGSQRIVERFDGTTFTTIAGGGPNLPSEGADALSVNLGNVRGVAAVGDAFFICSITRAQIYRVDASGVLSIVAGNGTIGFAGDGDAAPAAELDAPSRVAVDAAGRIFEAEIGNHRVRVIDGGVIDSVAGAPPHADLSAPVPIAVALDREGRVLFADQAQFVARLDPTGPVVLVGNGTAVFNGDGLSGLATSLDNIITVAVDSLDRIVISQSTGRIRRFELDGTVSTIAGNGDRITVAPDGSVAASSPIGFIDALAIDALDRVYFVSDNDATVRRIESDGTLVTLIGDGIDNLGFVDDCPGRSAEFSLGGGIAVAPNGDVYIADTGNARVRKWDAANDHVSTFAGTGELGFTGDGAQASQTVIGAPNAVSVDDLGRVLVSDGVEHRIVRVDVDGTVHTVIGDGVASESGDGGPATSARTSFPGSVVARAGGSDDFVFAEGGDTNRFPTVRVVDGGVVTTVIGVVGPAGTGALATGALASPSSMVSLDASTLLVAAGSAGVIERIVSDPLAPTSGTIDFVAGALEGFAAGADPLPLSTPDGTEGRAAFTDVMIDACGIAWDPSSSFAYVADRGAGAVYRLRIPSASNADASTWTWALAAGVPGDRRHVDGADAASTRFVGPCGLALDAGAAVPTLFVADVDDDTVRTIDLGTGASSTIFGVSGAPGNLDDLLAGPAAIAFDPADTAGLFVADTANHRVRRLEVARDAAGAVASVVSVTDVVGTGEAASSGDGTPSRAFPVDAPAGLVFDASGDLLVTSTRTVRLVTPNAATGIVDGGGAVLTIYGQVPRVTFPEDSTFCLSGIDVKSDGVVRVVDGCQGYLLELTRVTR